MYNANWLHSLNAKSRGVILILLLAGLALLQQTVSFGGTSRLQVALNNAAHVPWFFVVTYLLWHITGQFAQLPWRQHLLGVAALAVVLATGLEAAQFFTSRDADIRDVGLNLIGACSALLAILGTRLLRLGHIRRASLAILIAAVLIASGFTRAAEILWVHSKRDALAPILITFDRSDIPLQPLLRGNWEVVTDTESHLVGKITLSSDRRWPSIVLREPVPDWNTYQWLVLKAYTESEQVLPLEMRLETRSDRGMESTVSITLDNETRTIRIPLEQLSGDRFGRLDSVKNLYLFSARPDTDRNFYLESISLE